VFDKLLGAYSITIHIKDNLWQCDYFLNQNQHGLVDIIKLNNILANAV